jgi:hypothetical protein
MLRRTFVQVSLAAGAAGSALAARALAQDGAAGYPNKPVMVIVPFAAAATPTRSRAWSPRGWTWH